MPEEKQKLLNSIQRLKAVMGQAKTTSKELKQAPAPHSGKEVTHND